MAQILHAQPAIRGLLELTFCLRQDHMAQTLHAQPAVRGLLGMASARASIIAPGWDG